MSYLSDKSFYMHTASLYDAKAVCHFEDCIRYLCFCQLNENASNIVEYEIFVSFIHPKVYVSTTLKHIIHIPYMFVAKKMCLYSKCSK